MQFSVRIPAVSIRNVYEAESILESHFGRQLDATEGLKSQECLGAKRKDATHEMVFFFEKYFHCRFGPKLSVKAFWHKRG